MNYCKDCDKRVNMTSHAITHPTHRFYATRYEAAAKRISNSPIFDGHHDFILAGDDEHLQWLIDSPIADVMELAVKWIQPVNASVSIETK